MKRSIIIFFAFICFFSVYGYEIKGNSVVFTSIIEDTGTIEHAHSKVESFFAIRYNDVNNTIKLNKIDNLVYKGLFVELGLYAMGMWTIDAHHMIDVSIKEGRIRIKISVSEAVFRSTGTSTVKYMYSIPDSPPFTQKCSNSSVAKKSCESAFIEIEKRIENIILDFSEYVKNGNTNNDDW